MKKFVAKRMRMSILLQVRLEIEKVLDIAAYKDNARCCSSQSLNWLHPSTWRRFIRRVDSLE